jgi:hypothetical protein
VGLALGGFVTLVGIEVVDGLTLVVGLTEGASLGEFDGCFVGCLEGALCSEEENVIFHNTHICNM